jgi:hypothetical protein
MDVIAALKEKLSEQTKLKKDIADLKIENKYLKR